MATTVSGSPATLTVTLTEACTLNGYDQGASNVLSIGSIAEVSKRIVTITDTEQTILTFGSAIGAGTFVAASVRYIRITNKDDTNHCILRFMDGTDHEFAVLLDFGQSFIYNGDLAGGVAGTFDAAAATLSPISLEPLTGIKADAATGTIDLEVFVAST